MKFTASESVAMRVLSKFTLSFITGILTDEQICSPARHHCDYKKELAISTLPGHTNGLILDPEETSTLAGHLKLCCFYPNVAVNCISPNAFLKALCNLTDSSVVCCSCAKPLLVQNINCDSQVTSHMETVLKTFLGSGTKAMRTTSYNLLWNLVEMKLLESKTAEYIMHYEFPHESEEFAKCVLGCTQVASHEGKQYNYYKSRGYGYHHMILRAHTTSYIIVFNWDEHERAPH